MNEYLKRLFAKDYIKASEIFDSKDIEANFKLLLYSRLMNALLYFIYFCFTIFLVWSIRFLLGYSSSGVPTNLTISFLILVVIHLYISYKVKRMSFLNPTKSDKRYYKENPQFEKIIKKILNIKEK